MIGMAVEEFDEPTLRVDKVNLSRRSSVKPNRLEVIPGLILIVLGIVFLLAQYLDFGPGLFLLLLGSMFLIFFAVTRSYGLLIPGCILVGIGLGLVFDRPPLVTQVTVPIGLGIGFLAIFVGQLVVNRTTHWWPLIPGGLLLVTGIAEGVPQIQLLLEKGWPLILVAIGLMILMAPLVRSNTKKGQ
jgi:hypothetical protein